MSRKGKDGSYIEELRVIRRALSIIREISPKILRVNMIKEILAALTPYIAICMSALIIDELVGERNLQLLIIYVLITTIGTFIFNIFDTYLQKEKSILTITFSARFKKYLNVVKLNMDYAKLEDPKYTEQHSRILGTMFMVRGGITSVVDLLATILGNIVTTVIAMVIILQSFTTTIKNREIYLVIYLLIIIASIVLTVRNSKIMSKKEFALYQNCATNRYVDYYHYQYMEDDKAAKDIHIFDQRTLILDEIKQKARKPWMHILLARASLSQIYFGANSLVSTFLGGFTYFYIGLGALKGEITLGNVTRSYASIVVLISATERLFGSVSKLFSNNQYLRELYAYIDTPCETFPGTCIPEIKETGWKIAFHNVSFRYPAADEYALNDVSFEISKNSLIAIVGMNGSGKTTVIKLLCGFYRPQEGCITLNGKNIEEYNREEYIKLFSVVFQDFRLFAFPIGENVAASSVYDADQAWNALHIAGLVDRVGRLPFKMEQFLYKNVETDGVDLSGGEEQKLAIARAIYKDAPFIILDEPTAALDPMAEYEIYKGFHQVIDSKTAIFISHRLSSCRFCKEILVFDAGRIVQRGTHDELIKNKDRKYFELWNAQAQYYTAGFLC